MPKLLVKVHHKGGPGSGNWGHTGRPGLVGGSGGSGGRLPTPISNPRIDTRRPTYASKNDVMRVVSEGVIDGPRGQLGVEWFEEGRGWFPGGKSVGLGLNLGRSAGMSKSQRVQHASAVIDAVIDKFPDRVDLINVKFGDGEGGFNHVILDVKA